MDFRPYFHIHDVDFDRLLGPSAAQFNCGKPPNATFNSSSSSQSQSTRGVLLGVTNPFFETICKGWPHIVSLGHVQAVPLTSEVGKGETESSHRQDGVDTPPGASTKEMRRSSSGSVLRAP